MSIGNPGQSTARTLATILMTVGILIFLIGGYLWITGHIRHFAPIVAGSGVVIILAGSVLRKKRAVSPGDHE